MKYTLSEEIIRLIAKEKISQKCLVENMKTLHKQGKINRVISQQSLSRYLRGQSFPDKDTKESITKTLCYTLGVEKLNSRQKKKDFEKIRRIESRNKEISVQILLETQYQILEYWRNAPEEIQNFWLETLGMLNNLSDFIINVIFSMKKKKTDKLPSFIKCYYFEYCFTNLYDKYRNEFSNEQILILGKLMIAAGNADEKKYYQLIEKDSEMEKILAESYQWKPCRNNSSQCEPKNEKERYFIKLYENSNMSYQDFMRYASIVAHFERINWLVIYMAYFVEKLQKEKTDIKNQSSLTKKEEEFLCLLKNI